MPEEKEDPVPEYLKEHDVFGQRREHDPVTAPTGKGVRPNSIYLVLLLIVSVIVFYLVWTGTLGREEPIDVGSGKHELQEGRSQP